jgi:predicted RNA-binding protein (TIGR00451 family)
LPKIIVKDTAVAAIAHGASVKAPGVCSFSKVIRRGSLVGVFSLKGELIALARAIVSSEELIQLNRGIVAEPIRVIMDRRLYPVLWKKDE